MSENIQGKLIVFSGPSGVGKGTIVKRLLDDGELPLKLSVSATTRAPRPQETDGVNYHFLTHEQFRQRREAGEFLECKEVFGRGDWYGTLRSEVEAGFLAGKWVVLEIDVAGAGAVLEEYPNAISIFLDPGSMAELERRLRDRKTETEESIQRRLEVARGEMDRIDLYRHRVVNDDLERTVQEVRDILIRNGE